MKARRLLGAIFVVVMALFVCAIQGVRVANDTWIESVRPLTIEDIHRDAEGASEAAITAPTSEARMVVATGIDDVADYKPGSDARKLVNDRDPMAEATSLSNSNGDSSTKTEKLDELAVPEIRLTSKPTQEQIQKKFLVYTPADLKERKTNAAIGVFVFSPVYTLRGSPGIPGDLGRWCADAGEFSSARSYLREAVRVEPKAAQRGYYCAYLAWLEDDPEISAALLEESLAAPELPGLMAGHAPANALHLAFATGSDEAAAAVWVRYHDILTKFYTSFENARQAFGNSEKRIARSDTS